MIRRAFWMTGSANYDWTDLDLTHMLSYPNSYGKKW